MTTHERLGWHVHNSPFAKDGLVIRETYKPDSMIIAELTLDDLERIQKYVRIGISVCDAVSPCLWGSRNSLDMQAVMRCLIQTEWVTVPTGMTFFV